MVDGLVIKHINLKKDVPQTVEFTGGLNKLGIVNMGNHEVYFKVDDITLVDTQDNTANFLNRIVRAVDIDKDDAFTTVTFVSNGPSSVQWDFL